MTYTAYMMFETENNLDRFKDLMTEKKINDIENKFAFKKRDDNNKLYQLFKTQDGRKKYLHYLGFKKAEVDMDGDSKYSNPNNIDYSTLFVETFQPNVLLHVYFKTDRDMRLRYEISNENKAVIFSNYIYYKNRGVDKQNQSVLKSNMSHRYEPNNDILTGRYVNRFKNGKYSNYFRDLHKLIIDIKKTDDVKKIVDNYVGYEYSFAFEDFDRIDMDNPFKKDLPSGDDQGKIYKYCECQLFISPGNYNLKNNF